MYPTPQKKRIRGKQYRIIPTQYPPINFFEKLVPNKLMGALFDLEAQTNPRLQNEVGNLSLVDRDDYVSGPGATIVMAAFTHIGYPSRFSRGIYGVYYAARSLETAIRETVHHRQIIASDADLEAQDFSMRAWIGTVKKFLCDLRADHYIELHNNAPRPESHSAAQEFGEQLKQKGEWGIVFNSVRDKKGQCIAALRPPTVSLPIAGPHLIYQWDGTRITQAYERSDPIITF